MILAIASIGLVGVRSWLLPWWLQWACEWFDWHPWFSLSPWYLRLGWLCSVDWVALKATVHASFQPLSLLEIAWYWMSPARRMAANGQKWCETWKKGNNVMNVFIFCSYNSSFDVAKWFQSSNFFNFKLYQKGIKSWSRIFKSQKNVHIILKIRYKIQDYLVKVKVDKI